MLQQLVIGACREPPGCHWEMGTGIAPGAAAAPMEI